VSVQEGRVNFDPRRCWVDVWAFQRLIGHIGLPEEVAAVVVWLCSELAKVLIQRDEDASLTMCDREDLCIA
jgi:hypothetical protein